MPQDAFTLRLVARELDSALRGGKVNKINQPEREELSLLIYTGKRTLKLTANANAAECGVYFTEDEKENPLVAPNFCMLLRKHLSGAEILGVGTDGFERILVLRFRCFSDFSSCERELRCEIMGKYSNLILTENGIILGALKTTMLDENCKRVILAGAKYVLPPPQEKTDPSDLSALAELLREPPADPARFLFLRVSGLAPCTAEQIAASYRGGSFARHVHDFIFSDAVSPRVVERDGVPVDFFARAEEGIPFPTLSEAQSYFYSKKRARKRFEGGKRKLTAAVAQAAKKQEKRLAQILDKERECASAEENRIKGELLTANLHALARGMKRCELQNYYDERGGTVTIALDETLTPVQNAQNYFKKYRKQKRAMEYLRPQERETREELDYLASLLAAAEAASCDEDIRSVEEELLSAGLLKAPAGRPRKKAVQIPFRTCEKEGFRIYAGRNNLQNDRLVRSGAPEDIWLHAQKYHSCHVVIKTEGREVPEAVLLFAAGLCARYSDAKGGGKVPVDYCRLKFVKKPPGARAGSVIYTDHRTILVDPAEWTERDGPA